MIFGKTSVAFDKVQTIVKTKELHWIKKSQEEGQREGSMIRERPEKKDYKHKKERSKSRSKNNGSGHEQKKNNLKCIHCHKEEHLKKTTQKERRKTQDLKENKMTQLQFQMGMTVHILWC